ncbi:DNA recombination protein RmuC [Parasphingorhabdus sp.]|uniref:DNA recombination protein RmuC n=1 Tax=Parasphingorhabdus sp. TaxID=2709688 RepID=UPI003A92A233
MDPIIAVIAIVIALLGGLALGWVLGSKPAKDAAQATRAAVQSAKDAAQATDALRITLDGVRDERDAARTELAALQADARNHEKQMQQLLEAKEALSSQFSEIGAKMLETAQRQFLERADQRFDQANEKGGENIAKLLQPVRDRLTAYEESIRKIEKERSESYADIKATVEQVRQGQDRVQQEAARLVNSLRNAPKSRGRWGEQQLKNVLETCGLAEHTDFQMEVSIETDEGRLRPDAIVRIPGGRSLIIDAKVSLNDYQDAFAAENETDKKSALDRHCLSMKAHINALGAKSYQTQFETAPDYVIMFVPGEHFLAAALDHDPNLWNNAFDKKVLLATPTNLVAIARTVASVWQQESLNANATEIAVLGKEMHERLAKAAEDLQKVGTHLGRAVTSYNGFANSFQSRLIATGRKFEALEVEKGKRELTDIELVEALPRYSDSVTEKLIEDDREIKDEAAE